MEFARTIGQLLPAQLSMSEEDTQPLPTLRGLAFRAFLNKHRLSILDVALAAGVRLLVVWNIAHDNPISRQQATMVRTGLYRLTGLEYHGGILLRAERADYSLEEAHL